MPEDVHGQQIFRAGIDVRTKMVVPVLAADPAGGDLVEGLVWFNSTANLLKYYDGAAVIEAGAPLSAEQVQDVVGAMVAGNTETGVAVTYDDADGTLDFVTEVTQAELDAAAAAAVPLSLFDAHTIIAATADNTPTARAVGEDQLVGRLAGGNIAALTVAQVRALVGVTKAFIDTLDVDAATLDGSTLAQVIAAAIAGVVDTAPGTLDTLNELAAALGDDANFAATTAAALATKARSFVYTTAGGALTENVDHGLNTRDLVVGTYLNADPWDTQDYRETRPTVNRVVIESEAGNIVAGMRVVIFAVGA